MSRYLTKTLQDLLRYKKIILLSGPRQVGKTTLARSLQKDFAYYNYDIKNDYNIFKNQSWDRKTDLVIFDEIHKMKKWKLWLKSIYDEGALKHQKIIVTGSARLEILKKVGDSLAGRHFYTRLWPFDLKELKGRGVAAENYQRLIRFGGFPEPYYHSDLKFYNLWKRTHLDLILRQDLLSLEQVRDIEGLELLVQLLSSRVGSTVSYNALSEDLDRDDKTIKKWIRILEDLYVIFKVEPYSKNIARAKKKQSKFYFFDIGRIDGDEAQKFENLVALSLQKEMHWFEDQGLGRCKLNFIQNSQQKEIDFAVQKNGKMSSFIEVKLSDTNPSGNFKVFESGFSKIKKIQLVLNAERRMDTQSNVQVEPALNFLENLSFDHI